MGYDLHVTRKSFWADEVGPVITAEEWLSYVARDPSLSLDPRNGPYHALWSGASKYEEPWVDWSEGELYTKNPDPPLIGKLLEIAAAFDAKVRGDDNEVYTSPTEFFHEPYVPEPQEPTVPEAPAPSTSAPGPFRKLYARLFGRS